MVLSCEDFRGEFNKQNGTKLNEEFHFIKTESAFFFLFFFFTTIKKLGVRRSRFNKDLESVGFPDSLYIVRSLSKTRVVKAFEDLTQKTEEQNQQRW